MSTITEGAAAAGLSWLPDSVRALLLVSEGSSGEWGGIAAAEMAHMIGLIRPHTLLVNTAPGPDGPDRPLSCQTVPGLTEAMQGREKVRDVVVDPPDRSFLYIPAGRPAAPLSELISMPPFQHLVRAAARGGTLLLYATESDLRWIASLPVATGFSGWFDGMVMLGERGRRLHLVGTPPLLARVERQEPASTSPPAGARSGFSRPKKTPAIVADRETRPAAASGVQKILTRIRKREVLRGFGGVTAVWLAAIVAVWLVWQGLSGWPAFQDDTEALAGTPTTEQQVEGAAPEPDPGPGEAESSDLEDAETPSAAAERLPPSATNLDGGLELPYSVLVGSYVTSDDAAQRRDELADEGDLAFIAPTQVRGRLYYRVFVGAYEDRTAAEGGMRRLVETGRKERERAWDMRPVRFAFSLGAFDALSDAELARDRLHELDLPAYVLPADTAPEARFHLYSGAFESEEAAAPLDSILSESGNAADLQTRRGRTR